MLHPPCWPNQIGNPMGRNVVGQVPIHYETLHGPNVELSAVVGEPGSGRQISRSAAHVAKEG
jgi:hypothetical protein